MLQDNHKNSSLLRALITQEVKRLKKNRFINLCIPIALFFTIGSCEKQDRIEYTTQNAKIIDFVTEKCYCCWGWIIKIGNDTIRAEEIPGVTYDQESTLFPIAGDTKIGKKTTECESYSYDYDYYEILEFKIDQKFTDYYDYEKVTPIICNSFTHFFLRKEFYIFTQI